MSAASPLFISGAVCLAIFGVLLADRATGFGSRFAPWILFLALGVTGIIGGIISVAMDGEESMEAETDRTVLVSDRAYRRARSLRPVHRSPDTPRGPWSASTGSDDEAMTVPDGPLLDFAGESERPGGSVPPRTVLRSRGSVRSEDARDVSAPSEKPLDDLVAGPSSEDPLSSDEAIGELDRIMAELGPKVSGEIARRRRSPS